MEPIVIMYITNAVLLLLHEIESAYEKEWEILKIPGAVTGFLLLHIPIIFLLLYGLLELERKTHLGLVFGLIFGIGGVIPFIVHKILVRKKDHFNRLMSNMIIYLNIASGIFLAFLALQEFVY
jgi:hypothetical protein